MSYVDKSDEYLKYHFSIKPVLIFNSRIVNHIESSLIFGCTLVSKLNFGNLRWANVEGIEYDFNGFSFGIAINYVF